jgi:hypothetical protein
MPLNWLFKNFLEIFLEYSDKRLRIIVQFYVFTN